MIFQYTKWKKEETERFKDYLSPIKLSVYTSVIVSILLMDYGGEQNFVSRIKGSKYGGEGTVYFSDQ